MPVATVVILGGGFAGVKCAKTLRQLLPKGQYELVLFNKENHIVFSPLLAEVASAAIKTKDVAAPLRQILQGVKCRTEDVLNIDLDASYIEYEAWDKTRKKMHYDHLVISCGNTSNLAVVPGMDEHSFPLKTVGDALKIQAHVIDQMEKAEVCEDPEKKKWFLTFTVIGGGFSGVEVAGELNDLVRASTKFFENIREDQITVNLVHSQEQILPEVSPALRDFARKQMEKKGVKFYLSARAAKATHFGVYLHDERVIPSGTVVCTIGATPLPIVARLQLEKLRGRIVTNPDMTIPGHKNAWAIGDCSAVPNAVTQDISPPTGQFAERQGYQVAHNVVAALEGKPTKPFSHKTLGHLCAIGGHSAVAEVFGKHHVAGFPAWFLWRAIYLSKLPSLSQKIKVGIEWACDVVFPRDLVYVKTDTSKTSTRAFYSPGDYIFRQGDPATDFFVIEQGEVDILIWNQETHEEETVAVLGPGDFFGEAALVANLPRNASVRARDDVMAVVLGRGLFAEMSANLAPLRDAVAKAGRRRRNVWKDLPDVRKVLDELPMAKVLEPVPGEILKPEDYVIGILELFRKHQLDFCCVVDPSEKLVGVITRSDLLRTIEAACTMNAKDDIIRVQHIMGHEPVVIGEGEPVSLAVSIMREHGLKNLPVVDNAISQKLVGCVRIETILCHVVQELTTKKAIRITKDMANPFASSS